MTLSDALMVALVGSMATVLLGLAGLAAHRRLTRAQTGDTDASAQERRATARRTDAETWGLLQDNLVATVGRLSTEVDSLHAEVDRLSRTLRQASQHITDVHDWDIKGRPGPIPQPPAQLVS